MGDAAFGVQPSFLDAWGRPSEANPDTVEALRAILGDAPERVETGPGGPVPTCHLPRRQHLWGWAAQLYAVRSRRSWGIGDLHDLARLGAWSRSLGAAFIQLNPLHAAAPVGSQEPSPYFPSSRRFRNPTYIAVERVPGFAAAAPGLAALIDEARGLTRRRLVDHTRSHEIKLEALRATWATNPPTPGFDAWLEAEGPALREYATYCVLAETHGADWRAWPAELRRPHPGIRADPGRVRFHAWLQWLLDRQLERAARELPPICDLAIGADPAGADAWTWADQLIPGFSVGAPPDDLNLEGQDWGFPAFHPGALMQAGFAPFRETVRANLRHALGLRIDHVMGLFRLWLIPHGGGAQDGAYVTYPAHPMLDILAEESRAAGALVIGEDLGTVAPGVRDEMARRRILSYRLLWFELGAPAEYPASSLAAVGTHDLPTLAGAWTGADAAAMRAAGLHPNAKANRDLLQRLAASAGLDLQASPSAAVLGAYRALRQSPSRLRAATLEDALVLTERPNIPGTIDEWPNWRIGIPGGLEGLRRSGDARALAAVMNARR